VLGGKVMTEIDELGQKARGFVYLGNSVLAWQQKSGATESVLWEHRDASNASFRVTNSNTPVNSIKSGELDPLGTNAEISDPQPPTNWKSSYPDFGSSFASADSQCMRDGMMTPCSTVSHLLGGGAASRCPNDDCGPRSVTVQITYTDGQKETHTGFVNDPSFNANVQYTGAAAGAAAEQFHLGMADGGGGFEVALMWTLIAGDMLTGRPIGDSANHFTQQNSFIEHLRGGGDTSYGNNGEKMIDQVMEDLVNSDTCAKMFEALGLGNPFWNFMQKGGIVFGPASLLNNSSQGNLNYMGITEGARQRNLQFVNSNSNPGFTIRDRPDLGKQTTDGRPRIFLNTVAFDSYSSLRETIVHEMIHVAGVRGKTPWLGLGHDLKWIGRRYAFIMMACT
jgi:hypothetical protein